MNTCWVLFLSGLGLNGRLSSQEHLNLTTGLFGDRVGGGAPVGGRVKLSSYMHSKSGRGNHVNWTDWDSEDPNCGGWNLREASKDTRAIGDTSKGCNKLVSM